jgi:hypothetical protein
MPGCTRHYTTRSRESKPKSTLLPEASLNIHITLLQGELCVVVAVAESHAAVMAERDVSIAFITMQLERDLKDETAASLALAQARTAMADTVRAF